MKGNRNSSLLVKFKIETKVEFCGEGRQILSTSFTFCNFTNYTISYKPSDKLCDTKYYFTQDFISNYNAYYAAVAQRKLQKFTPHTSFGCVF